MRVYGQNDALLKASEHEVKAHVWTSRLRWAVYAVWSEHIQILLMISWEVSCSSRGRNHCATCMCCIGLVGLSSFTSNLDLLSLFSLIFERRKIRRETVHVVYVSSAAGSRCWYFATSKHISIYKQMAILYMYGTCYILVCVWLELLAVAV